WDLLEICPAFRPCAVRSVRTAHCRTPGVLRGASEHPGQLGVAASLKMLLPPRIRDADAERPAVLIDDVLPVFVSARISIRAVEQVVDVRRQPQAFERIAAGEGQVR